MIDREEFTRKQVELTNEFAQYLVEHPEVDEVLPEESHLFFEIDGDPQFNRYSRELAERQQRAEDVPVVMVRIKGLAPPHGSRLLEPIIQALSPKAAPRGKSLASRRRSTAKKQ